MVGRDRVVGGFGFGGTVRATTTRGQGKAMTEYSHEELRAMVGKVPERGMPAVWWVTTDPAQIAAYEQWKTDYEAHVERIQALADSIGVDVKAARLMEWGKTSELTGFVAPYEMRLWPGNEKYRPVPQGWRLDKKNDRLVPSRKTKADRESQANKDFAACKKIPALHAYLSGLPSEIYLDDRDMGGTMYRVNFRRGESCVWAYCGGDPDRSPDARSEPIDTEVWHRQKLSALIALREEQAA